MNRHEVALRIAADHPCLAGHFPGFPILPGVVLLDETLHALEQLQPHGSEAAWNIGTVKFHHIVHPGEELQLRFEWQADAPVHFELRTSSVLVASGTIKRRARIRAVV
jgi:3-hydroxymyristoyl/3-hydroxydecanoyl-(acyl carrier protein) dehydratase